MKHVGEASAHEPISLASRGKRTSPFGQLRQDEMEYLAALGASPRTMPRWIHLLVCLRARIDARAGEVRDGRASLARWTATSEKSVTRGLAWLEEHGLIRRGRFRDGARWVHWIRPLRHEDWPPIERAKLTRSPNETSIERAKLTRPNSEVDPAKLAGERAKSSVVIQRSSPESFPESEAPLDEISLEDLVAGVTDRWRSTREARARTHFVDGVALRWLQNGIREAVRTGCTPKDVQDAVEDHIDENFADPRELPRWAAQNRDDRLSRDHEREILNAKTRREAEHDALVERERAERVARGVSLPSTFEDALASAALGPAQPPMPRLPAQLSLAGFEECTEPLMPFLRKDRPGWGVTLQLRPASDGTPRARTFYGRGPDDASSNARRWRRRHPEEFVE